MESFVNRALAYLGLKDIDDEDELYDEYEDDFETPSHRGGHTAYPEREPEPADTRIHTGGIRPIGGTGGNDDAHAETPVRSAVVRPLVPNRTTNAEVRVVAPARFSDAQEIGDVVRQSNPVIVNLTMSERDLARRMIDFCSGLTYALNGQMRKVADQVFLLTPSNVDIPPEERQRLQERGLYRP